MDRERRRSNGRGQQAGGGVSRTKQSEGPHTDVNTIMNRYMRSGEMNHLSGSVPRYGDFSAVGTLQDQLNAVHAAQERFMALPAPVRAVAGHDQVRFLEMLASPEGTELLIAAGLDAEIQRVDEHGKVLSAEEIEADASKAQVEGETKQSEPGIIAGGE